MQLFFLSFLFQNIFSTGGIVAVPILYTSYGYPSCKLCGLAIPNANNQNIYKFVESLNELEIPSARLDFYNVPPYDLIINKDGSCQSAKKNEPNVKWRICVRGAPGDLVEPDFDLPPVFFNT